MRSSLERFGNRFAMGPTIGCLANIVSEIPAVKGLAEHVLKAVISGDQIQVEFKYRDPAGARPTARLICATNELPKFWDRSEGLWRRLLIIPFNVIIPEEKQDRKLAVTLCEQELPGLLNWALTGLRRLRQKRAFTVPESSQDILEQHRLASNPARQYLKEHCEHSPNHKTPCNRLYGLYKGRCDIENTRPLNRQQFGHEVRRVFPTVERKQLRTPTDGNRQYYYVGLRQKSKEKVTPLTLTTPTNLTCSVRNKKKKKRKMKKAGRR